MFEKICPKIRKAVYGMNGLSQVAPRRVNHTNGTAFMIAPGILATAAHLVHVEADFTKPVHSLFEVIRAPDIGQKMEAARLIVEDTIRDIALLKIEKPRSKNCIFLKKDTVSIGTNCGSLGFPLAIVGFTKKGRSFNLIERYQGANISAFHMQLDACGRQLSYYETDALMYGGSSGCPGFLLNGQVFGMHVKSVIEKPKRKSKNAVDKQKKSARLAISLWVPSADIISFAKANNIALSD